MTERLWRG
uniref:Uncharacterized protein n=1 Tax=Anguilla anguilla TaxID=7936 RepID=A0A0E9V4L6_ANGAN